MPRNDETPEQREARVKWLRVGVRNGLYHVPGEEIGNAMEEHSLQGRLYQFQQNLFLSEGELPLPERLPERVEVEALVEAPSITDERYAQARDAQIRACYGLNVWERRILYVLLLLIGILVIRNLPGIREWEGWR